MGSRMREDTGVGIGASRPLSYFHQSSLYPAPPESRLLTDDEAVSSKAGLGGFF